MYFIQRKHQKLYDLDVHIALHNLTYATAL